MKPDVAIVGGGPAGIACAIQLKRFDINPCLFEKDRLGGLLWNAKWVENYPGFFQGISGPQLAKQLKNHLEAYVVNVKYEKVSKIEYSKTKEKFSVQTTKGSYLADIIVAASGTTAKRNNLLELCPQQLKEKVFFEIYPILNKKGKKILIVGAGDIAFDYALNLSANNEITIIYRGQRVKALPLLYRRVRENSHIRLIAIATIKKITRGRGQDLAVTFAREGSPPVTSEFDYIVGAMGREPQADYFSKELLAQKASLVSGGGLYFVGDVKNGDLRQVAIAVGNGIEAAMKIYQQVTGMLKKGEV